MSYDDDFIADEDYTQSPQDEDFLYTRTKDKSRRTPDICMFGQINLTHFFPALTEREMAIPELAEKLWANYENGDLYLPLFVRNYKDSKGRKRVGVYTGDKTKGIFLARLRMPFEGKKRKKDY